MKIIIAVMLSLASAHCLAESKDVYLYLESVDIIDAGEGCLIDRNEEVTARVALFSCTGIFPQIVSETQDKYPGATIIATIDGNEISVK